MMKTAPPAPATPDPKLRVKVYELNEEGEWGDKGTGHVQFQIVQSVDAAYLFVHSEIDSSLLLESKVIMDDDAYSRQGDTIISWNEPFTRQDIAVSFAEPQGCQETWEKLCAVRGIDPKITQTFDRDSPSSQPHLALPPVSAANLQGIMQYFSELSPFMREGVAAAMLAENYTRQLLTVFVQLDAESPQDTVKLRYLYAIFKQLVSLNESSIIERLMDNDHYIDVFGVFEYDPDITTSKPAHRLFMKETVKFRQVLALDGSPILPKIHMNFRLQYLRDVVLPRALDDATFNTLNSLIFFSSIEIVQHIQNDKRLITELFQRFQSVRTLQTPEALELQGDVVSMLQEMCALSKVLQIEARSAFLKLLHEQNILGVFDVALKHPVLKVRLAAFEVLTLCVNSDASAVRVFMLDQDTPYVLFNEIIQKILYDPDQGSKGHATEILRRLLDPDSMEQSQEKNKFLNMFYEVFMDKLVSAFSPDFGVEAGLLAKDAVGAQHLVCELFTFFVLHHGYRIKYFVLRNHVVNRVCDLLSHPQKHLALAGVRFMRACVGLKDEFYFRYMVKSDSFLPLVQLFKRNEHKYNLINSAIIELFDFIRKENIKSLVAYITEKFEKDLRHVTYVDTFRSLWSLQEKNSESSGANRTEAVAGGSETRDMTDQEAEDAYFSTEDPAPAPSLDRDVDFTDAAMPPLPTPLVPYPDDLS